MKVKWLIAGVLLCLMAGNAYAINDQSIRGENTFGLIEDSYDLYFYPEFLPDFEGYEVYTNLHNTSGANRFQIGFSGLPKKAGRLFLTFNMATNKESEEVSLPLNYTPNWPDFLDPGAFVGTGEMGYYHLLDTNFFDDDNDGKTDRSILRDMSGESWREQNDYSLLIGYGISISKKVNVGLGVSLGFLNGEKRDPLSTYDISYTETDLNTKTVLESYRDRSSARIDAGGSNIGFIIGTKFEPKEKLKIGIDFFYSMIDSDGAGKYGESLRTANWTKGSSNASLNETLSGPYGDPVNGDPINDALPYDGSHIDIRLKTYIPAGEKNTIRVDGVFEWTSLDVSDGRYEKLTREERLDGVQNEKTTSDERETIEYSGDYLSGNGISLLLADIIEVTNFIRVGFGFGYEFVKREIDVRRTSSFNGKQRIDRNNDGDAIDDPLDYDLVTGIYDERWTDEASITQGYKYEVKTHYFKIPVATEIDITKKLSLRLGVSHFIIVNRDKESLSLISGSEQMKIVYEDGMGNRGVFYSQYTIPEDRYSNRVDRMNITDYRIGLGINVSKNISIDLLGDYYDNHDSDTHTHELSIEPHEASRIWSVFGSATIKF
jgi:hypothetical protein